MGYYTKVSPFQPAGNGVTVSTPVSNVAITIKFDNILPAGGIGNTSPPQPSTSFRKSGAVRLVNAGNAMVFVELVTDGQTAFASTGLPILPGSEKTLLTGGATSVAAVTAGGTTSTLYATPGEGGI